MDDYPTRKHGNGRDPCFKEITALDTRYSRASQFQERSRSRDETEENKGTDNAVVSFLRRRVKGSRRRTLFHINLHKGG